MPRPANLIRVVLVGVLPQGEQFQTGFWFSPDALPVTQTQLQAFVDTVRDEFAASSAGIRALSSLATLYDEFRAYYYPTGGNAPASLIAVAQADLPGTGSNGELLPLQISLVSTSLTGIAGRRYRGRQYWPMNSEALVDHQVSQAGIDAVCSDVSVWYAAVNDNTDIPGAVVVVSAVGSSATAVTAVSVDSRPDVQRRRAESQTELRQQQFAVAP